MLFNQTTYEDGTFLTYTVEDESKIDKYALNTVSQADIDGVFKMNREVDNGKTVFYLNITSKVRLSMILDKPVNRDFLFAILTGIAKISIEADDYLLNSKFFLFDYDDIYVDLADKKVSLIYLPIEREAEEVDAKAFIKKLMFDLTYDTGEDCNYVANLLNLINSRDAVSMEKLIETIEDIKKRGKRSLDSAPRNTANTPASGSLAKSQERQAVHVSGNVQSGLSGQGISQNSNVSGNGSNPVKRFDTTTGQASNSQGKEQIPISEDKPAKEKKSSLLGGLFSKKEKPPVQPRQTNPGINIPGQKAAIPQPAMPQAAIPQAGVSKTPAPNQAIPQPSIPQPKPVQPTGVQSQGSVPQSDYAPLQNEQNYVASFSSSQEGLGNTVILGGAAEAGHTVFLGDSDTPGVAKITRVSTNETATIKGNVFKIGKEKDYVDFFISGNKAVSRIHAQIDYENGQYYLEDINSLNHSYLGNDTTPLQSGQKYMLKSGMRFRLADEEFIFSLK